MLSKLILLLLIVAATQETQQYYTFTSFRGQFPGTYLDYGELSPGLNMMAKLTCSTPISNTNLRIYLGTDRNTLTFISENSGRN